MTEVRAIGLPDVLARQAPCTRANAEKLNGRLATIGLSGSWLALEGLLLACLSFNVLSES